MEAAKKVKSVDSLQVGHPYITGQTEWVEGSDYGYFADGHVLIICIRSPERRTVDAVQKGKVQLALTMGAGVFYLMYRFGRAIGWSAAPYVGSMIPNERRSVPAEGWPAAGVLLKVVMVDAATGKVRALRSVPLPPGFGCELNQAIRQIALLPALDKKNYEAALSNMRRLCPTNRRLLQRAEFCTGAVPREKLVHRICLREYRLNLLLDLVDWFTTRNDDKYVSRYAAEVMSQFDKELLGQGFMRVDRSGDIPHY